jgi:flagellar assembly factor FliW
MQIQSSRFGWLSVEDNRIMTFPRGLLGFPTHKRFALIQTNSENYFFWLQSIDDPALAFVVTDPGIFFKDYDVPVREETVTELELDEPEFLQTFTICNRVGEWLTGNLLGPLLVNSKNRLATQVVLTEKKWTTRHLAEVVQESVNSIGTIRLNKDVQTRTRRMYRRAIIKRPAIPVTRMSR